MLLKPFDDVNEDFILSLVKGIISKNFTTFFTRVNANLQIYINHSVLFHKSSYTPFKWTPVKGRESGWSQMNFSYISKIQLVVYYQCCILIGWASTRLYVIAHKQWKAPALKPKQRRLNHALLAKVVLSQYYWPTSWILLNRLFLSPSQWPIRPSAIDSEPIRVWGVIKNC